MKWIDQLFEFGRRIRLFLLPRQRFDRDLEEEMRLHRDLRTRENIDSGLDREEAGFAAQRRFGNSLRLREEINEAWSWMWLDNLLRDTRYAFRRLRNQPGFT